MPLAIIGILFIVMLSIYSFIKNKSDIDRAFDKLYDKLDLIYGKLINELRRRSGDAKFTVEDEDVDSGNNNSTQEKEEEHKILFFPHDK